MEFKIDRSRGVNNKKVLFARVQDDIYERCIELAKKNKIGVSDLFRQMVVFCLENMEGGE